MFQLKNGVKVKAFQLGNNKVILLQEFQFKKIQRYLVVSAFCYCELE